MVGHGCVARSVAASWPSTHGPSAMTPFPVAGRRPTPTSGTRPTPRCSSARFRRP